ncbi:Muscle M-line assembly protein unc-89 [Labeo rohita]|uniref:Muscle M-line assembly protein unc-89 n=1 Tax=Labeo rohita TaxID=84645 RepID=A0ABQ8MU25_LABRO|nr:Muscle M-line assembly protein unc-89 [Labeo rohita]
MVLFMFVSASCSSRPTSLFPLVTPPCLALVCLIVCTWSSCVLLHMLGSFPSCFCCPACFQSSRATDSYYLTAALSQVSSFCSVSLYLAARPVFLRSTSSYRFLPSLSSGAASPVLKSIAISDDLSGHPSCPYYCRRLPCPFVLDCFTSHSQCCCSLRLVNKITFFCSFASGSHSLQIRDRTNQPTRDPAMSIRIVPPSTAKGRLELQRAVASLRQQGQEVGSFAQFFWTMARGLEYPDSTLKEAFNLCLDDPLPPWEMEQLRGLDYWTFSKYLHHRKDWQILTPPESACRDHATHPLSSSLIQDPFQSPTLKRRLRRKKAAKTAVSISESTELTAVSAEVINTEDPRSVPVLPESVQSSLVIPEPYCSALPVLSPSLSQVPDHLLTPRKRRSRRKGAAQNAASVSEPVESKPASPGPLESAPASTKPAESAPASLEPVESTPASPVPVESVPASPESIKLATVISEPIKTDSIIPEMAKLAAISSKVVKFNTVNSEAATAAAISPEAADHTLLCPLKPKRRRARVVKFDTPSQGVPSPLAQEGPNQEIPGTLVQMGLSQEAPSPGSQEDSSQEALPSVVLEDQSQKLPSLVAQVNPGQVTQGPVVLEEPTLMVQYPVFPEVCNLVEPHLKLPTSPVVSDLVKETQAVHLTLPEPPVNPVMPKKGTHVMSSEPVLVPDPEALPEHPNLPATAKKAFSVLPTSRVMTTKGDAVSQVMFSEIIHASVTDACPEKPNSPAMTMETDNEQSTHPVMATEAVLKQPALTVLATEVMFMQPAIITTQANPEQPVLSATAPVQEPPEVAQFQESAESVRAAQEGTSESSPVSVLAAQKDTSESSPVFVRAAQEGMSEPSPEPALATQESMPESSPVPVLTAQKGTSESSPMFVPEALESASKSVTESVLVSPESVSQGCPLSACAALAPEFVPRSFVSQELATKAIPKTPPVRQTHVSRKTTIKIPITPSPLASPFGFPKPEHRWSTSNYSPELFSSLPVPPLCFLATLEFQVLFPARPPSWYLPVLFCPVWTPGGAHWEEAHGSVYVCVCLVLLSSHLLVSPGHALLFSPCLLDCLHLVLMCAAPYVGFFSLVFLLSSRATDSYYLTAALSQVSSFCSVSLYLAARPVFLRSSSYRFLPSLSSGAASPVLKSIAISDDLSGHPSCPYYCRRLPCPFVLDCFTSHSQCCCSLRLVNKITFFCSFASGSHSLQIRDTWCLQY